MIFHFVGVSKHVAAGCGCNEADRMRETALLACHPSAVTVQRHLENNYNTQEKQNKQINKQCVLEIILQVAKMSGNNTSNYSKEEELINWKFWPGIQ